VTLGKIFVSSDNDAGIAAPLRARRYDLVPLIAPESGTRRADRDRQSPGGGCRIAPKTPVAERTLP